MKQPEDKAVARLASLPDETRQALAEFFRLSGSCHPAPATVEEELSASIALKECLSPASRN